MKKDGFTLVELLAVIVILSILALITVVSVNKTLTNSKNSLSKIQINNVVNAAKTYYINEGMNKDVTCVNISELISKDYIESNKVLDPKTKKSMEGSVNIINKNNKYSYEYQESVCG